MINYYYQRGSANFICKGTSNEFDYNLIHEFIDLRPENIIQIPNEGISDFVKLNLKINVKNIINISSQNNLFNSKNYSNLIAAVESSCYKQDRDSYKIRRTTQEENSVLKYKISNKYYSAKNIKWDKSRIRFP